MIARGRWRRSAPTEGVIEAYFGGGNGGKAGMSLLEMTRYPGGYGGATILNGVNIAIEADEIGVIVGPNGAGKSTTLKAIFGLLHGLAAEASCFDGETITNLAARQAGARGALLRAAGKQRLPSMTVEENLEMGAFIRRDDFRRPLDRVYGMFPPLEGEAPAAGRRAFGRPAPDGGDGPRADEPSRGC